MYSCKDCEKEHWETKCLEIIDNCRTLVCRLFSCFAMSFVFVFFQMCGFFWPPPDFREVLYTKIITQDRGKNT